MERRRRNSLRLKGYDYSQPGEYFITICTADRRRVFGEIVNGKMRLSETGRIVDLCWKEIPEHFPNTRLGILQIMPNHLHGIIEIKNDSRGGLINQTPTDWILMKDPGIPLGKVIRSFKARSTYQIHKKGEPSFAWQRNFYDHIIRDDTEHFFIEQYIRLNPIIWELDSDDAKLRAMSMQAFETYLREEHGLDGYALRKVVEHEVWYRRWALVHSTK